VLGKKLFSWRALLVMVIVVIVVTDGIDGLVTVSVKPKNIDFSDEERINVIARLIETFSYLLIGVLLLLTRWKWVKVLGVLFILLAWIRGFVNNVGDSEAAHSVQFALNIAWAIAPFFSLAVMALIRIFLKEFSKEHTGFSAFLVFVSACIAFALGSLTWLGWIVFGIGAFDPDASSWIAQLLFRIGIVQGILNSPIGLFYSFHVLSTATFLFSFTFAGIFVSGAVLIIFRLLWPSLDRIVYAIRRHELVKNRFAISALGLILIGIAVPKVYKALKFIAFVFGADLPDI
jgi:hypothetical protein